jgi:hypothetical protein
MENRQFQTGVIKPIECAKEGWALIKDDYWILFAVSLVGGIIGGVTFFVLFGAMVCGMFYCYLRKIDTGRAAFDDLWKGFQWWLPGLVVTLFIVVPLFVVYGIIYVPVIMAVVMGSKLSQDELLMMIIGAAAVDLIFVVIMVCFHTLLMFAYPLIVDRGLGAMAAISTSARAVLKNLGGMVGLLLVNFGLALLGQLACGIGMYFVMPVLMAANVVAYRKVFPKA